MNRNRWPSFETAYWLKIRLAGGHGRLEQVAGRLELDRAGGVPIDAHTRERAGRREVEQLLPLRAQNGWPPPADEMRRR